MPPFLRRAAVTSPILALLVGAGVLLAPARGEAFCRSTTCRGNCARDDKGCKTSGAPLYWAATCVGFSFQEDGTRNIPNRLSRPAIVAALFEWVDRDCPQGGTSTITFTQLDDVACHK